MANLLKWEVEPVATGPYSSFSKRGWPMAFHKEDGRPAVQIICDDEYIPSEVKTGNHSELTLLIAVPNNHKSWDWRKLKLKCQTLKDAKTLAEKYWKAHS